MLFYKTKSNHNSPTITETSNELKILQDIYKTVDLLLINRMKNELINENSRNCQVYSSRFRDSPRHNKLSARPVNRNNLINYEDLTEITITDAVTEPSESPRSFVLKEFTQTFFPQISTSDLNFTARDSYRWPLVAPDSSYKNTCKFNKQNYGKNSVNELSKEPYFNKQHSNNINFPFLRIESPITRRGVDEMFLNNDIIPNLKNTVATNDQFTDSSYDFLVKPSVLLNLIAIKQHQKKNKYKDDVLYPKNNSAKGKYEDFFIQNLLKVDNNESYVDHPSTVSFSTKSSVQITDHEYETEKLPLFKTDDEKSPCYENIIDDHTMGDGSTSDSLIYHGYMITPDFVSKIQMEKSSKLIPFNEMSNFKDNTRSKSDQCSVSITNNEYTKISKYSPPVIIENLPSLPPDILGNITLKNGNDLKKFLSVRSVDDPSWNDCENIILNDNFTKHKEMEDYKYKADLFRQLNIIVTDPIIKDELTTNILEADLPNLSTKYFLKNNLVKSLKEMDKKMIEMEKISAEMQHNFAKSKELKSPANRMSVHSKEDQSTQNINQSTQLSFNQYQTQSEDISQLSSNDITKSINSVNCVESNKSSQPVNLDNFPKLNLNFVDNDSREDTALSNHANITSLGTSSCFSEFGKNKGDYNCNIKRPYSMQRSYMRYKNRNERDQKMYIQRKLEARKLAFETLTSIGLPIKTSSDIPLNVINNLTPNEMMLNQLCRNERLHQVPRLQSDQDKRDFLAYKPVRHVSFINKVRMQRPEITRRKSSKKPISYTNQLLELQPKCGKRQTLSSHIYSKDFIANKKHANLSARSIISEDTDVNSVLTDWSVPELVKKILNEKSERDGLIFYEDLSQIQSLNSNSVIDWDQISEILHQHEN